MLNIQEQLDILGITGQVYKMGKEMKISCPFHDDHNPSASVNLETGRWICYARCGGGSWMDFLERIRCEAAYAPMPSSPSATAPIAQKPVLKSLLARGFTREIFSKWDIEWDVQAGAMRLPVYNRTGALQGRIWRFPQGVQPKYRYSPGFERNQTLYGLWRLPTTIATLVLVEGPLDAIWVFEAGTVALAIMGSSLSETQVELIQTLHAGRILLCFDNDEAGQHATQQASNLLRTFGCWVYRVLLPTKWKDLQEVPHAKVMDVLTNLELCVNGSGLLHPRYRRWAASNQPAKGIWKA